MLLTVKNFFNLSTCEHGELFENVSMVWEPLKKIEGYFQKKSFPHETKIPPGVYVENEKMVFLEKNAVIEPGCFIRGPCIIGSGTRICFGAYLREFVVVGKNCVVGHGSEVKNSILMDGVHLPHFNYVGNSILGNGAHLGAGAICANLRLDGKTVKVFYEGEKIDTGLRKLGVIMGDGAQMGCNSVANPGSFFLPKSMCAPLVSVKGIIHTR